MALNEVEKETTAKSEQEHGAPYTYYCPQGHHNWTWSMVGDLKPPAGDGSTINCPLHSGEGDE